MKEKTRKEKMWLLQEQLATIPLNITTLLASLIYILLFPAAILVSPIRQLRIGLLYANAMGRLYGNTEYFLRERKFNPPKRMECVFLVSGSKTVNSQILTMVERQFSVTKSDWLWDALHFLKGVTPNSPIWIELGCSGWLRGHEWADPGPQLHFSEEEHQRGQNLLRKIGIPEGTPHICFFAKDRMYADSPATKLDPDSYWGSRDFRNCEITNYLPAVKFLAEQGIYSVRMGIHQPEKQLPTGLDQKIIDYTSDVRSTLDDPDFADAYLQSTCKFFLGATSGIYLLSSMFGVPIAYANVVPYGECGRMPHDIVIFKKCRDRTSNDFISFPTLIARGVDADWLTLEELTKLDQEGVEFCENTGDEILDLAREMNMRLDHTWIGSKEDEALQKIAQSIFTARAFDGSGFPGRIGARFLEQNRLLLNG
jgi:putative glycosyltransferase (TIGR04372 family)